MNEVILKMNITQVILTIWWGIYFSLFQTDNSKNMLLFISIIFTIKVFELAYSYFMRKLSFESLIRIFFYVFAQISLLEIGFLSKDQNAWINYTLSTIVLINQKALSFQLTDTMLSIGLAFLPIYSLLRIIIELYYTRHYRLIESLLLIISFIFLQLNSQYQQSKQNVKPTFNLNQNIKQADKNKISSKIECIDQKKFNLFNTTDRLYITTSRTRDQNQLELQQHSDQYLIIQQNIQNRSRQVSEDIQYLNPYTSVKKEQQSIVLSQREQNDYIHQYYKNLLNTFPEGILIINQEQVITYMNNKCEKFLECSGQKEVINKINKGIFEANLEVKDEASMKNLKSISHSQYVIEDFIRRIRENRREKQEINIIQQLLNPNKIFFESSYMNSNIKNQNFQKQQSELSGQDSTLLAQVIKLYFQMETNRPNSSEKKLKLIIHQYQDSNDNFNLLIMIKNLSSKQKLMALQKEMKFQNSLLGSFSHELRTPLNCSLQMLSVAKDLIPSQQKIAIYIQSAFVSNQLLLYQLNDILDFSAMKCNTFCYQFKEIELSEVITELETIYREICQSKRISFSYIDKDSQLPLIIRTDKNRILQVLVNLLNNAIKFTKEEGSIQIIIKKKDNKNIQISVKDNGVGITFEKLETIQGMLDMITNMTSQFIIHEKECVGLGIRISCRIVEGLIQDKQCNRLKIKSKLNQGTKISFFIQNIPEEKRFLVPSINEIDAVPEFEKEDHQDHPRILYNNKIIDEQEEGEIKESKLNFQKIPQMENLCFQKLSMNQIKEQSTLLCSQCIHVLIVDDVPFNQIALKAMLLHLNIKADQAYDGYQAIVMVKKKMTEEHCKYYKIILMDIEMPGIDGFQTTKELLKILTKQNEPTKIVMCSAYDSVENIHKGKHAGMVEILPKPVRKEDLRKILKAYLNI